MRSSAILLPQLARAAPGCSAAAAAATAAATSVASCGGGGGGSLCPWGAWAAGSSASCAPQPQPPALHRRLHGSSFACAPHTSTVTRSAAAPPSAPPAAPGGAAAGKPPKGASKGGGKGSGGSGGGGGAQDPAQAAAQLDQLKAEYRRSRMMEFYQRILSRELLLKLNVRSVNELPRLERVDLAIQAKDVAGASYVEKWQLLLHALGLEIVTGRPAKFALPASRYYAQRNAVTGAHVSVTGPAAHDVLEKIVFLLLPSQNAFEGLLVKQLDRAGNMHFKVPSMVNFPDYEEMFETFENLGSLDVNLVLRGVAKRPGRSRVLLTGLQLPVLARRHQVEGAAAAGGGGGGGEA